MRQGSISQSAIEGELTRARSRGEAVPDGVEPSRQATMAASRDLDEIRTLLEQLQSEQQTESEQMQQLARQLAQQQQQLAERQQQLEQQVGELEQSIPTADGSASQSMQQAGESMQRAEDSLSEGRSVPGEGHQRDAASRLKGAQEQLQQQMSQYQQMQQRMQQMQGQGSSGDKKNRDGQDMVNPTIEIPTPEAFQTPEAYRRALLEGMEADVPEEYEALKKRYYEELVRQ